MKYFLVALSLSFITLKTLASPALNEFTLEEKVKEAKYIYIAEVIGVVDNFEGADANEIQEYIQIRVLDSFKGEHPDTIKKVVSDNGLTGSELGLKCVGETYLFLLQDHITLGEEKKTGFLDSVNMRFAVYKIENDKVLGFEDKNPSLQQVIVEIIRLSESL